MASATAVARARLGGLLDLAERSPAYRELASRLERSETVTVMDATAGARAFGWSALVATGGRTVALVAPSEDRARRWRAELAGWLGEDRVLAFPEREPMPFEISAPSGGAVHQRLLTLWRLTRASAPVAVVTSLRALLLKYKDQYVRNVSEKLLTYALGRGVEYQDMPLVRKIVRDAAPANYRFSSLVLGVVRSEPFQFNTKGLTYGSENGGGN